MRRLVVGSICLFLIGGAVATGTAGESLAEIARREAERRAKQKSDKPVKTYGEADLASAKGGTYNQMQGTSVAPATPPESGTTGPASVGVKSIAIPSASDHSDEAKRTRAASLKSALQSADAAVQEAERDVAQAQKQVDFSNRTPIANYTLGDGGMAAARARLASAKEHPDEVKRQRDDIEETARREGIPPGWIR